MNVSVELRLLLTHYRSSIGASVVKILLRWNGSVI